MTEPLVAIHDYYNAFSTLKLDACLPFFTLPCMFIGLRGTFAVTSRDDLAKVLGPTFEMLKTKDYQRSEFIESQLTTLTENMALARGVAVRYRASGAELERVPTTYLVHQSGGAWKLAVVASPP
jgi:hypothetical protein